MNIEKFYPLYLQSNNVVIDSRKVNKGDLFFAFSGTNYDAAQAAEAAIQNGAIAAIVENPAFENSANHIFYVKSTLRFLQDLAKFHRNQINIPIIGLTGSNGKTTTKELIFAVLSKKFNTQCTFGNLNNHIGVPLTILSIKAEHEIAVVEMGANHQNEIAQLCEIAQPDIGYITNFGKAHLEGFGGFIGVIKGKSELYNYLITNNKKIIVNDNDPIQIEKTDFYKNKITFGKPNSDYYFEEKISDNFVGICYQNRVVFSNLTGNYNFNNLCAAVSLGLHYGIDFNQISEAIKGYQPTNMRSQVMIKNGKTYVLDTYNANPSSMAESLKNFSQFVGSKTIIIGDMLELGEASHAEHQQILDLAKSLNFNQIITVGPHFKTIENSSHSFLTTADLARYLEENPLRSDNILLKASRGIALEKILDVIA